MINWEGGSNSPFLSSQEVNEIIAILGKRGMVGKQNWMTVGYGYNSDGEDVDWYKPDSSFVIDEFWEQELFELQYYNKGGYVVYPFDKYHKDVKDVKFIQDLQDNIEIYVAEILYDYGYEILPNGVILESFEFGSGIEPGRNDNYESHVGADWVISVDATKIVRDNDD